MKLLAIAVALAGIAVPALPGQDLPPWVLELSRVKRHARESFQNIPNYVCQETVVRSARSGSRGSFREMDTLRLQVASVGSRELLAPKGAKRFEDVDPANYIDEVVKERNGAEKKNAIQFSACQAYTSDSVIDYGAP